MRCLSIKARKHLAEMKKRLFAGSKRRQAVRALSEEQKARMHLDREELWRDMEQGNLEPGDVV